MEFYAVSELLIADKPYICGIEIGQWELWASQYKVAKVHRITKDSPCGKRFFNDVQVAGFLLRELEFLEDSPGYVSETVTYLDSEKNTGVNVALRRWIALGTMSGSLQTAYPSCLVQLIFSSNGSFLPCKQEEATLTWWASSSHTHDIYY
jgi:hypothetical protein